MSTTANLGPITVQLQDPSGNAATSSGVTSVHLSSNSAGTAVFSATAGGTATASVSIAIGQSSATFFYGDTRAGAPIITTSATSLTSATQTATINNRIVFATAPSTSNASATANMGPITVQMRDGLGSPVVSPVGGTSVTLASNSAGIAIFALTSGGTAVTTATISAGQSSATFFYGDTKAASPTITASGTSLISATQTETINPGTVSKLAFTSGPVSAVKGTVANMGPISVQLQDTFSNPVAALAGGTTVTLASSTPASGTTIFALTSGGTAVTTVTISAGQSSASFWYGYSKNASPTITVSSGSLAIATQMETATP